MSVSYFDFETSHVPARRGASFWLTAPKGFVLLAALLACASFWIAATAIATRAVSGG